MQKPSFAYTTYIKTTPERLWQALTEPAFTERYWRTTFETDWQVGSTITWHHHGVTIADPEQVVLESEPYRRLSYTWHTFTPELAESTTSSATRCSPRRPQKRRSKVTFEIEPLDELCKLTVVHDGFEPGSTVVELISGGWPHVLSELKTLLETGETLAAQKGKIDVRKLIAAFRVSLDGFIQGPNGEVDWVDSWDDTFDLMPQVDALVLGGGMYPSYEQYWSAVHADPQSALPITGKPAPAGEIEYARFAHATPHFVLSTTLDTASWQTTRIVRDVEEIRAVKEQPGKDIYAVGGATLVSSLMNRGLVDELRLDVHPIVLGGGKALFNGLKGPHQLQLLEAKPLGPGQVRLIYEFR